MDESFILIQSKEEFYDNIKIAGFDFDFTLVKTKSKKKFPIDSDDWLPWDDNILNKLKSLVKNNYKLVIFSNQNGVGSGKIEKQMVIDRFNNFINYTGLDWTCIAAINKDIYRKPNKSMWLHLFKDYKINMKESFYVGDAAGRLKNYKKGAKKDFSCSDRKFAMNLKLDFYTPDEFFLNEERVEHYELNSFDPSTYKNIKENIKIEKDDCEMIILVGCPGSGKSTFAKTYFKEYVYINQDKLKTKNKCLKLCQQSLENNKSVVIDNTNPDKKIRKQYIDIAKSFNYSIKCFYMNVDKNLGKHMNYYRFKRGKGIKHKLVPDIVYNVYFKKYEEPKLDEGFDQIKKIDPNFKFKKNNHLELFLEFN